MVGGGDLLGLGSLLSQVGQATLLAAGITFVDRHVLICRWNRN